MFSYPKRSKSNEFLPIHEMYLSSSNGYVFVDNAFLTVFGKLSNDCTL